jgi:TonB family protein
MNFLLALIITVSTPADTLASFPGGDQAFDTFIKANLRTTQAAVDANITGTLSIKFTIDQKGKAGNFLIAKPLGYGLDEEALAVLTSMPAWQPGVIDGRRIKTTFTKEFTFTKDLVVSGRRATAKPQPNAPAFFRYTNEELQKYLSSEFKFPRKKSAEGFVVVKFTISDKGTTEDIKLVSGIDADVDNEILRVVGNIKTWEPAHKNFVGVASNAKMTLSVKNKKILFQELQ